MSTRTQFTLASGSPRRAELLTQLGLSFDRYSPDIDETPHKDEVGRDYVLRMASEKLAASLRNNEFSDTRIIVCADTTVLLNGEILGKPVDQADAIAMLSAMSGKSHQVLTSVAIGSKTAPAEVFCVETIVAFRTLSLDEIKRYWATGEPSDKAGSYGAQGVGSIFIAGIEGSFSNVVGLPLTETAEALQKFGISVLP